MATEKPRFTVILEPEIANQLDTYWHVHKLKNKNAAINELLRMALNNNDALSTDETRLLHQYRAAPPIAKQMALQSLQTAVAYSNTQSPLTPATDPALRDRLEAAISAQLNSEASHK